MKRISTSHGSINKEIIRIEIQGCLRERFSTKSLLPPEIRYDYYLERYPVYE